MNAQLRWSALGMVLGVIMTLCIVSAVLGYRLPTPTADAATSPAPSCDRRLTITAPYGFSTRYLLVREEGGPDLVAWNEETAPGSDDVRYATCRRS